MKVSIHDMWVTNTDAYSYLQRTVEKFLQGAENKKKKDSTKDGIQQLRHFYTFLYSIDGLLGTYDNVTLKSVVS